MRLQAELIAGMCLREEICVETIGYQTLCGIEKKKTRLSQANGSAGGVGVVVGVKSGDQQSNQTNTSKKQDSV